MPLNAGDAGYDQTLSAGEEASETTPLLIPPEPVSTWQPLNKQELEAAAGGPGWRRVRHYLVLLFWLTWVAMLSAALAIVALSPRPVPTCLKWWQKSLFYRIQPDLDPQVERSEVIDAVCERLPHLRSLGIKALILEGMFHNKMSPANFSASPENTATLTQIQHLLAASKKADLRVVLDFCKVDLLDVQEEAGSFNHSAAEKNILRFWLQQGVAGFAICDTDAAYSAETLQEWRAVLQEFSTQGKRRILVVKQTSEVLRPLNDRSNMTLINVVMKSILPESNHLLSAAEVADAVATRLQTRQEAAWPSWTVGGDAPRDLKPLFLVLMMTLPGSPAFQHEVENNVTQDEKTKHAAGALFNTLSHSKSREEALLYGAITVLSVNSSSNTTSSPASSPPVLAFLRSWGCVHFLVLLNIGPEPHFLDPEWAPGLPEKGVFVASTGMNHLGSVSLSTITLQPHEALVIKLFQAGRYA